MSTVAQIKERKPPAKPVSKTPARPIPVEVIEPMPMAVQDFATRERKAFIQSVSPLIHKHERRLYLWHLAKAAVFGLPMPHERVSA